MEFNLDNLVRENVKRLVPYSTARAEFDGTARVYLDANENSFRRAVIDSYWRYPDPLQKGLKARVAEMLAVDSDQIFVGNGSDEAIDLLFRIFCRPRLDNAVICPPTYGMYEAAAGLNDVSVRRANLTQDFQLSLDAIFDNVDSNTKLIFVCSPNNPTGNTLRRDSILQLARSFHGLVILDEAYIHFSSEPSLLPEINKLPNLVVLQTFSKAWALAGLRVGLALADSRIIDLLNKVKPPYNVSAAAQTMVISALRMKDKVDEVVCQVIAARSHLADALRRFEFVKEVYSSEANFLLVKMRNAARVYESLLSQGVIVRDRSREVMCEGCLRITVGTPVENKALIQALENYEASLVY